MAGRYSYAAASGVAPSLDTYANAAATPEVGAVHFCTDSKLVRYCFSAGTWTDTLPGRVTGACTVPQASDFATAVNAGASTINNTAGHLEIISAAANGTQMRMNVKAYTSGAHTFQWLVDFTSNGITGAYGFTGMCFRDGVGGAGVALAQTGGRLIIQKFTNATTFGTGTALEVMAGGTDWYGYMEDDGTNLKFGWSPAGKDPQVYATDTHSDWMGTAPTQVGFFNHANNALSLNAVALYYDLKET